MRAPGLLGPRAHSLTETSLRVLARDARPRVRDSAFSALRPEPCAVSPNALSRRSGMTIENHLADFDAGVAPFCSQSFCGRVT
jgi:hypothetical protein